MASGSTITFSSLWGHLVPSHTWKDTERGRRMNEPWLFSWISSSHLYISLKSYCHSRHRLGFHSCHFQIYSGTSSGLQTSFLTRWLSPGSYSHGRLNETHCYLKKKPSAFSGFELWVNISPLLNWRHMKGFFDAETLNLLSLNSNYGVTNLLKTISDAWEKV